MQEDVEILGGCCCVSFLKLERLSLSWIGTHGDAAGVGVGANEISDEEIPSMKILCVFVDHQADEKISPQLGLFIFGKGLEGFGEDFVGGSISYGFDNVFVCIGDCPGVPDGGAALGDDGVECDRAADGDGDSSFLENVAVVVDLGFLIGEIPA